MKTTLSLSLFLALSISRPETSLGSTAAVDTLKSLDYRYFVAGGTCAAISHGITTPVDVVKTRIQAEPQVYDKGLISATASIIKTDGPQALLGGLGPTIVGYGIEGAMKFGVYEIMKPVFADLLSDNKALAYILASIVAGAVASLILCPMESTRIRIVTDKAYADMGLLTALPKILSESGFWSVFGGVWAMLSKQVPYTFGKQVSFDVFAKTLYKFFQETLKTASKDNIKWLVSVVAAFGASLVASIFSQPGDMILTDTYRSENDGKSFSQVVRGIHSSSGLAGFFTGTGARIVHVGLIITSQLVIYDIVKQLLGLPATGSH